MPLRCIKSITRLDAYRYDDHFARDMLALPCYHRAHTSVFAHNLSNLLRKPHIDPIMLRLLQHKIGSGRIQHFRPQDMVAQEMADLETPLAQRLHRL